MVYVRICWLLLLSPCCLCAQDKALNQWHSRNAFLAEAGGRGLLYSLSFERRLALNEHLHLCGQLGAAPLVQALVIPAGITLTYGPRRHHLEGGAGRTTVLPSGLSSGPVIRPQLGQAVSAPFFGYLGYRYEAPEGGLVVRAGLYTFMGTISAGYVPDRLTSSGLLPWAGVSVGYALPHAGVQ
ncbi:MAG: hypothetical protein SF053_20120 [Bacteroidia bacterium]|nr:hypothetical protein [Bacteroidia bacterium]